MLTEYNIQYVSEGKMTNIYENSTKFSAFIKENKKCELPSN